LRQAAKKRKEFGITNFRFFPLLSFKYELQRLFGEGISPFPQGKKGREERTHLGPISKTILNPSATDSLQQVSRSSQTVAEISRIYQCCYKNVISCFVPGVNRKPIPVATHTKAWVCGRSLAEIADLNATGHLNISFL